MKPISITKPCSHCGSIYTSIQYRNRPGLFCSLVCAGDHQKTESRKRYYDSPKACAQCSAIIPYEKRADNGKFCSHSCSATYINSRREKRKKNRPNKQELLQNHRNSLFEQGLIRQRSTLRGHLLRIHGAKCFLCPTTNDWQGKPLTLVVDHQDGDATNNSPSNLRLLCPNCNSQTETFGGRNKGRGRESRGLRRGQ